MLEALDNYLVKASEKLRNKNLTANAVTVFLSTNRFSKLPFYSNSKTAALANATNSTIELRNWTKKLLKEIFRERFLYKKVGVILQDLQPETLETIRLYDEKRYEKEKRLCQAIDILSRRFGRETVKFSSRRTSEKWEMICKHRSNRYTTNFREILQIK